ncbi:hypothetical protein PVAG01_06165 [Phlyctema vagabunda]|uniref:Uncharacterized protein n=1 Tax=Phlyctema vagabunda TaxID=108571 RepID=A0ABR4PFE9_9HELO
MAAYWDFREMLDVYPEESPKFCCVCIAPSKGRRCRNPAKDYRRAASILDEMDILKSPQDAFKLLESLAYASLCQHYHNGLGARGTAYSQVDTMRRQWERSINAFVKVHNETIAKKNAVKLAKQKVVVSERVTAKPKTNKHFGELGGSLRYTQNVQNGKLESSSGHTITVKYEKPAAKDARPTIKPEDDPFVSDTVSKSTKFAMNVPRTRPIVVRLPPVSAVPTSSTAVKEEKAATKDHATTVSVKEIPCSPLTPPAAEPSSNVVPSILTTSSQNQGHSTAPLDQSSTAAPTFSTNITMQFGAPTAQVASFSFVGVSATQGTTEAGTTKEGKTKHVRRSNQPGQITPKAVRRIRTPYDESYGHKDFNDQLSTVFDSGKVIDSIKTEHLAKEQEIESTPTKTSTVIAHVTEENFGYAYVTPQAARYATQLPVSSNHAADSRQDKVEPQATVSNPMSSVPRRKPLATIPALEPMNQPVVQIPALLASQDSEGEDEKPKGCLHGLGLRRFKNWVKGKREKKSSPLSEKKRLDSETPSR